MHEMNLRGGKKVQLCFLDRATTNWAEDVTRLARQLGKSATSTLDREALLRVVTRNRFLALMEGHDEFEEMSGRIVGMATLSAIPLAGSMEGIISDFTVLFPDYTRQNIEKAMVTQLIVARTPFLRHFVSFQPVNNLMS